MSWNFLRYTQPAIREMVFPPKPKIKQLPDAEFTSQAANLQIKNGRSWRVEELRLKSYEDLHKLWYVLLKEKVALKTDQYYAKRTRSKFYGKPNIEKVSISMARLLTVVNERKALVNEFRKLLEDQYVSEAKKLEAEQKEAAKEKSKIAQKKAEKVEKELVVGDSGELTKTSVLNEEDINLIKDAQKSTTQKQLLKKYVKNWKTLNPKHRRIALAKINAVRAGQAKEIIMKELYTISKQREMAKAEPEGETDVKKRLSNII